MIYRYEYMYIYKHIRINKYKPFVNIYRCDKWHVCIQHIYIYIPVCDEIKLRWLIFSAINMSTIITANVSTDHWKNKILKKGAIVLKVVLTVGKHLGKFL
jgi:hypothetical protein